MERQILGDRNLAQIVDRDRERNRPGRIGCAVRIVHPADDHAALVEQRNLAVVRRQHHVLKLRRLGEARPATVRVKLAI